MRKFRIAHQKLEHQIINKLGIGGSHPLRALRCVSSEKGLGRPGAFFLEDIDGGPLDLGLEVQVVMLGRLDHGLNLLDSWLIRQALHEVVDQPEVPLRLLTINPREIRRMIPRVRQIRDTRI